MAETANVGKVVGIAAGIAALSLVAGAIYSVYMRATKKAEMDANSDELLTKEEFDAYMDENGLPILTPLGKFAMTIISVFWKFDTVTAGNEE